MFPSAFTRIWRTWRKKEPRARRELHELERALAYCFARPDLLDEALCHRSFFAENSETCPGHNERLEFLGDAVLDLVVGHLLMEKYPRRAEGDLSRMRAHLVNTKSLAELARSLSVGDHLLLGKGEERSGGRDKNKLLADAFEAVIGAVYLDGGFAAAFETAIRLFAPLLPDKAGDFAPSDYKSRLQEWAQNLGQPAPCYKVVDTSGPDHAKVFSVRVTAAGVSAHGRGRTKKAAQQRAAEKALKLIDSPGG